MPIKIIRDFVRLEASSGILLFFMAILALICNNSILQNEYQAFLHLPIEIHLGAHIFKEPVHFWINDGLMSIFFLLVGLELKRAFFEGELAGAAKVMLPGLVAITGMLIPAIIFLIFNYAHPETIQGWSIPVATDIAFALGVLSLFGDKTPIALKVFLMALAVFDDVGAIIIIALFYSHDLSLLYLTLSLGLVALLWVLNYVFHIRRLFPYLLLGFLLWITVFNAGIHPTVAGVVLSLMIPLKKRKPTNKYSPLHYLEKTLHPWVAYFILPLFAFANAGLSFEGLSFQSLFHPMTLGIILGLFIGKQLGVFTFAYALIRSGFAKLPHRTTWLELYGVSILCGIGFTMSLFLGTLAFPGDSNFHLTEVRLGVLVGSILSGLVGGIVLHIAFLKKRKGGIV
ncbi:MAG TPA: Na+/H+ antiporter NhaA [Gammaproteobacteria bacterium]|jgi:NhaA family Na+:H+ antiporter|nr:Na+/H+ antiporter NhaA [Gammaproteobacteria bacterium]